RFVFSVLATVTVIWNHSRDAIGGRAPESVKHYEQFHDIRIDRRTSGLDDEDIGSAHILQDLEIELAVAETAPVRFSGMNFQMPTDLFSQRPVCIAGKNQYAVHCS